MGKRASTISGQLVYNSSNSTRSHSYDSEKIIYFYTRASRLGGFHGSYSWAATFVANVATLGTSDPLEHWWVIVSTSRCYYVLQKWKDGAIIMRATQSWDQANENGLCCAGKDEGDPTWRVNKYSDYVQDMTMGQLLDNMNLASSNYTFLNSNCQDFCVIMYNFVVRGHKSSSSHRYPNAILGFIPLGLKD